MLYPAVAPWRGGGFLHALRNPLAAPLGLTLYYPLNLQASFSTGPQSPCFHTIINFPSEDPAMAG